MSYRGYDSHESRRDGYGDSRREGSGSYGNYGARRDDSWGRPPRVEDVERSSRPDVRHERERSESWRSTSTSAARPAPLPPYDPPPPRPSPRTSTDARPRASLDTDARPRASLDKSSDARDARPLPRSSEAHVESSSGSGSSNSSMASLVQQLVAAGDKYADARVKDNEARAALRAARTERGSLSDAEYAVQMANHSLFKDRAEKAQQEATATRETYERAFRRALESARSSALPPAPAPAAAPASAPTAAPATPAKPAAPPTEPRAMAAALAAVTAAPTGPRADASTTAAPAAAGTTQDKLLDQLSELKVDVEAYRSDMESQISTLHGDVEETVRVAIEKAQIEARERAQQRKRRAVGTSSTPTLSSTHSPAPLAPPVAPAAPVVDQQEMISRICARLDHTVNSRMSELIKRVDGDVGQLRAALDTLHSRFESHALQLNGVVAAPAPMPNGDTERLAQDNAALTTRVHHLEASVAGMANLVASSTQVAHQAREEIQLVYKWLANVPDPSTGRPFE